MRTLTPAEATSIITEADRLYGTDDCNEHYIYASRHRPMTMSGFPLLPKHTTRCLYNEALNANLNAVSTDYYQVYTWIITSQALLDTTIKNYELDTIWWPELALPNGTRDHALATLITAVQEAPGIMQVKESITNTTNKTRLRVFMRNNQTFTITIE